MQSLEEETNDYEGPAIEELLGIDKSRSESAQKDVGFDFRTSTRLTGQTFGNAYKVNSMSKSKVTQGMYDGFNSCMKNYRIISDEGTEEISPQFTPSDFHDKDSTSVTNFYSKASQKLFLSDGSKQSKLDCTSLVKGTTKYQPMTYDNMWKASMCITAWSRATRDLVENRMFDPNTDVDRPDSYQPQ